jgi:hypothetical protein
MAERGALSVYANLGTREGGEFETPRALVAEYDGRGTINRLTLYDLAHLEAALAHFDSIRASTLHDPLAALAQPTSATATSDRLRPDPLRIPPNAATRAIDRLWECVETRDWGALRTLCAPIVCEDRRRLIRTTGGVEMVVATAKLMAGSGTRPSHTLLATAGDRLALRQLGFAGTVDGGAYEVDALEVVEVDAEGRIVAVISFDPADRRAADAKLVECYARSETSRWAPAASLELRRALIDHDLERVRALVPAEFVFDDHLRTGGGRIEGVENYVAWLTALFEQSADAVIEFVYEMATAKHGVLALGRLFGTLAEGGTFESVFVILSHWVGDRLVCAERFELEDLDVARARFEELRP